MVVVEAGRSQVGQEVLVTVTSVLTTANGRLVFGRPAGELTEQAPFRPRRAAVTRSVSGVRPTPAVMPVRRRP